MESTDQLQVDLTSQEDIRAKLPEARRIYTAKQEALRDLGREVAQWGALVDLLADIAGEPRTEPDVIRFDIGGKSFGRTRVYGGGEAIPMRPVTRKESPAQDRAIAALKRAGEPMGPTALFRYMQSQDLQVPKNPNALGAALWNASQNERIKKTADGLYALLDWDTDRTELQDAPQDGSAPSVEPTVDDEAVRDPGVIPGDGAGQENTPDDGPTSGPSSGSLSGEGSAEAASRF